MSLSSAAFAELIPPPYLSSQCNKYILKQKNSPQDMKYIFPLHNHPYEITEKTPQKLFEGNMTMSVVITL
jgi:hypothetical protein